MSGKTNQRIVLASRPDGRPSAENFRLDEAAIPEPGEGEVLLKIRYLSLDPYMRGRMSAAKSYAAPVEIGAAMEGGTVGEVVKSNSAGFHAGDFVLSHSGWQSYAVADASTLRKLDPKQAPVTTALGVMGMPGFTAYSGLLTIGQPKAGETVVIVSNGGKVNIRYGNGTNYARITSVRPGSTYAYVATAANGWNAVVVNGKVGWISGEYSKRI